MPGSSGGSLMMAVALVLGAAAGERPLAHYVAN
jgi:hypothetical protein